MADGGRDSNTSQLQNGVRALNKIEQAIREVFPNSGGTSTTATAGAIVSPGDYAGYIIVTLPDGSTVKVPYYSP